MTAHRQTELDFEVGRITSAELIAFLNDGSRHPVRVRLTRNRVTMASVVFRRDGSVQLRLHRAFLAAPDDVLRALRTYVRTRRKAAWATVAAYCRRIDVDEAGPRRGAALRTAGHVHDLAAVMKEVNAEFFNGRVKCRVGWGKAAARRRPRRTRSIRYGSWDETLRTVRVNPRLDDPRVPREFIRYIVFHEMLHAVVPREAQNGKIRHHTRQFRTLENAYPNLGAMQQLSRDLLDVV